VATHCNTLQHTATHCSVPSRALGGALCVEGQTLWDRFMATHCNRLQYTSIHCNTLQSEGTCERAHCVLRDKRCGTGSWHLTATHCNTLQHTATHCNTLQHTAKRRDVREGTRERTHDMREGTQRGHTVCPLKVQQGINKGHTRDTQGTCERAHCVPSQGTHKGHTRGYTVCPLKEHTRDTQGTHKGHTRESQGIHKGHARGHTVCPLVCPHD